MIKRIIEIIQKQFQHENEHKKKKYILILAIVGIVFIMLSNFLTPNKEVVNEIGTDQETMGDEHENKQDPLVSNVKEIEEAYEKDLQDMLNKISGVSEVEVMVNVDSTNVNVYEKDLIYGSQSTDETDKNGGERSIEDETKETKLVYIRQGDQEVPVLVQTKKPNVRGVFVIAKGVDNANRKQLVIEAVSRVLDVPTYKISVMPK